MFLMLSPSQYVYGMTMYPLLYLSLVESFPSGSNWCCQYYLHIWDRVLFSTPELRINKDYGHTHRTPISGHAQTLPPNIHVHRTIEHPGHSQRTPPSEHAHKTS